MVLWLSENRVFAPIFLSLISSSTFCNLFFSMECISSSISFIQTSLVQAYSKQEGFKSTVATNARLANSSLCKWSFSSLLITYSTSFACPLVTLFENFDPIFEKEGDLQVFYYLLLYHFCWEMHYHNLEHLWAALVWDFVEC